MIIGDTPQQLGQIEAADAMLIDGKIVTRDDYRALAAQVEALRREIQSAADWFSAYWPELNKVQCDRIRQMDSVAKATPQQHLAEIRAQAGRDGFIEGLKKARKMYGCELGYCKTDADEAANQYADSIRRGEVGQ